MQPPGFRAEWHCGVRVSTTGKLVAFISGIPATVRVNSSSLKTVRGAGGIAVGVSGGSACKRGVLCAPIGGCLSGRQYTA